MSLSEQIQRVDGSQNDILKKVLGAFGVTVGENKIDQLAALAKVAPLLKENSLYSSATAALFGLGADSVPDDAFAWIGEYNLHWWRRRTPAISGYVEVKEKVSKVYDIVSLDMTVKYSKNIKIDKQTGAISLVNPKSLTCVRNTYGPTDFMSTLCAESPLYFTAKGDDDYETLYYLPSKSTYYDKSWGDEPYTLAGWYNPNTSVMQVNITSSAPDSKKASLVTSTYNSGEYGEWEYLQSSDRSAYPDSGEQDGYEYQYLGVPFDNAATAPKIATGSYVGTGTSGEENKNSLTFNFSPSLLVIRANDPSIEYGGIFVKGQEDGIPDARKSGVTSTGHIYIEWNGNTVNWYSPDKFSNVQLNELNYIYYYTAIG